MILFWQAEQIFPKVGHFDLSFSCVWPQNRQSFMKDDLSEPLDGSFTNFTSRGEGACEFCAVIASSWLEVASVLVPVPGVVLILNPRAYKVFVSSFFLEDKTSAPDVFSSCSFIPRAQVWVKFSDGQFLWLRDMRSYVVKPFLSESTCFSTFFNNKSKSCG